MRMERKLFSPSAAVADQRRRNPGGPELGDDPIGVHHGEASRSFVVPLRNPRRLATSQSHRRYGTFRAESEALVDVEELASRRPRPRNDGEQVCIDWQSIL